MLCRNKKMATEGGDMWILGLVVLLAICVIGIVYIANRPYNYDNQMPYIYKEED